MKKIIVYNSTTGFSKQYAQWLSEDLGLELYSVKEIKKAQLVDAEEIIFVSSIFANSIRKLNLVKKYQNKLKVIAVGFSPYEGPDKNADNDYASTIKEANSLDCDVFYLRGGVCFERLGFFSKKLFSKVTNTYQNESYLDKEKLRNIEEKL